MYIFVVGRVCNIQVHNVPYYPLIYTSSNKSLGVFLRKEALFLVILRKVVRVAGCSVGILQVTKVWESIDWATILTQTHSVLAFVLHYCGAHMGGWDMSSPFSLGGVGDVNTTLRFLDVLDELKATFVRNKVRFVRIGRGVGVSLLQRVDGLSKVWNVGISGPVCIFRLHSFFL